MSERNETATPRRQIREMITREESDARQLSQTLGMTERAVYDQLSHLAKARKGEGRLRITPSQCLACNFLFKKRDRLTPPGRCPQCKSERITAPRFSWN